MQDPRSSSTHAPSCPCCGGTASADAGGAARPAGAAGPARPVEVTGVTGVTGAARSAEGLPLAGPDDQAWLDEVHWDDDGLVPAIAQDADSGRVLMVAWMNRESLALTAARGVAVYWSRSRQRLWRKGEESGHTQRVRELRIDCDQDVVLMQVEQIGGIACHTGRQSCFFSRLQDGRWVAVDPVLKDPETIYR